MIRLGGGRWSGDGGGLTPGEGGGGEPAGPPDDGWTEPPEPPEPGWPDPGDRPAGPVESLPGEEEAEPPVVIEVAVYVWVTQADGRVCPTCGPLDGSHWEDDDGPFPPLHAGCRCERRLLAVEYRTARADVG